MTAEWDLALTAFCIGGVVGAVLVGVGWWLGGYLSGEDG